MTLHQIFNNVIHFNCVNNSSNILVIMVPSNFFMVLAIFVNLLDVSLNLDDGSCSDYEHKKCYKLALHKNHMSLKGKLAVRALCSLELVTNKQTEKKESKRRTPPFFT